MKNIGPCKILRKFSANAYEFEFPLDIGISCIFNVVELYIYRGDAIDIKEKTKMWKKQLPTVKPLEIDKVLDKRITKRTRNKEYFQYLMKWKGHLVEDSTCIDEQKL